VSKANNVSGGGVFFALDYYPHPGATRRPSPQGGGIRKTELILPAGQIAILPVQSRPQKYFPSHFAQIKSISRAIPAHLRGVSRSSRTLGSGCDGRGSVGAQSCSQGGVTPVSDDGAQTNGADADGEVVWS
jgi:hypothetical protein